MDGTVTSTNTTTGSGSTNTNNTTLNSQSSTSVNNTANISNSFDINARTGNNSATNNTTSGGIDSGDVDVAIQSTNTTGSAGQGSSTGGGGTLSSDSHNTNTGSGSTNTYRTDTSVTKVTDITNRSDVNTSMNVFADTGGNRSENNTFGGVVKSGTIRVVAFVDNDVNGGVGGGGGPVLPPGVPGGGGGVPGGGGSPIIPVEYNGMGGDIPQELLPDYGGVGGGYVAAGSGIVLAQALIILAVSATVVFRKALSKMLTRKNAAALMAAAMVFSMTSSFTWAADGDPPGETTVTTQVVGPQGPIGPQGDIGPQGTLGPQAAADTTTQTTATPEPSASPSPASSSTQTNGQTGSSSTNQNTASTSTTTNVDQTNDATVHNDTNANLGTGGNTVSNNTQAGQVQTGSINGAVNVINVANSQFGAGSSVGSQDISGGTDDIIVLSAATDRSALPSSSRNYQTGPGSVNQNQLQNSNVVSVVSLNRATADNDTNIQASTGNNSLLGNTSVGGLQTGDINLAVNVINLLNVSMPNTVLDIDVWSILTGNPDSTIVVPNLTAYNGDTGPGSTNTNNATSTSTTEIEVVRHATAENGLTIQAETGNNTVTDNSQTGSISTGSVKADGTVINIANADIPTFYLVNVMGEWNGSLQGLPPNSFVINRLDNTGTGPGSDNTNIATSDSSSTYRTTNSATANNSVLVNATTGGNTISGNTSAGDLKTGSVNVLANVMNILNGISGSNGKFKIGIINIFGKPQQKPAEGAGQPAGPAANEAPQTTTVVNTNPGSQVSVPFSATTDNGDMRATARVQQVRRGGGNTTGIGSSEGPAIETEPEVADTTRHSAVGAGEEPSERSDTFGIFAQASGATGANKVHPLTVGLAVGSIIWLATEYVARRKLS